ncbi:hypothetical protein Ddye_015137 [Dipteronia dyeriana]|uniref:Reverse transcriptase domain-containing protein n=1 Tax=Dipteronia dyeriana TaxID=168575 RepID=A0AAD9U512_9ROSI|nr:hypothetical protein Ddye_015137 [Dipteronia dyeriana]
MNEARKGWKEGRIRGPNDLLLQSKIQAPTANAKPPSQISVLEEKLEGIEKEAVNIWWSKNLRAARLFTVTELWKEPQALRRGIVDFFKCHFEKVSWRRPSIENINLKKSGEWESARLEEAFSLEEVWEAVRNCDGDKVPGPDGLNFNFIKANWEAIKDDIMDFFMKFHNDGSLVKELNYTFIELIPKVSKPTSMGDFCPISLVGSMYKVVAKVLANRIKKVMTSIVGENQMAFIKDRQILDSFVIAEKIIHKWRKGGKGGLLVKLDFEKAYDSVDHFFLEEMLVKMGFGLKWRNWIKGCISTPKM